MLFQPNHSHILFSFSQLLVPQLSRWVLPLSPWPLPPPTITPILLPVTPCTPTGTMPESSCLFSTASCSLWDCSVTVSPSTSSGPIWRRSTPPPCTLSTWSFLTSSLPSLCLWGLHTMPWASTGLWVRCCARSQASSSISTPTLGSTSWPASA